MTKILISSAMFVLNSMICFMFFRDFKFVFFLSTGVTMREKRGGAMSKMQKLRKRLSLSFGRLCK